MSRSSPGRYAIHEFAKNVYSVSATDGAGAPLTIDRTDPYGWTVAGHDGTVSVTYTLFGDRGRRHLCPDRRDPRASEHARDLPVGARLSTTAPIRVTFQPSRSRLEGRDPAARRTGDGHDLLGAEPAVSDG